MKGGKTAALTLVILRSLFRNRPGRKHGDMASAPPVRVRGSGGTQLGSPGTLGPCSQGSFLQPGPAETTPNILLGFSQSRACPQLPCHGQERPCRCLPGHPRGQHRMMVVGQLPTRHRSLISENLKMFTRIFKHQEVPKS